jgi:hypothetical protein
MNQARLYLDGSKTLWAMVKCDVCRSVHRFPAVEAMRSTIKCLTCASTMDARETLESEVLDRGDIPMAFRQTLDAVKRMGARHRDSR